MQHWKAYIETVMDCECDADILTIKREVTGFRVPLVDLLGACRRAMIDLSKALRANEKMKASNKTVARKLRGCDIAQALFEEAPSHSSTMQCVEEGQPTQKLNYDEPIIITSRPEQRAKFESAPDLKSFMLSQFEKEFISIAGE
eukprot:4668548-Lingulodinium_polyedra.AAC.1